jgi:serine/threonine protein phosphatase 1
MKNIYIVSDVHGCYKSLLALIEQFPSMKLFIQENIED